MQGGREKRVPLHRRSTLEYATKGTYCDPHLQNRNVKLCSHQPSPKETIWFSEIRLDRLFQCGFCFFGGALSRAVQRFALFNHQQLSLHEDLCQLCYRIIQKTKNFPELLLVFPGNCSLHGSCGQGIFCCRGHHSAKRARLRWSPHVSEPFGSSWPHLLRAL